MTFDTALLDGLLDLLAEAAARRLETQTPAVEAGIRNQVAWKSKECCNDDEIKHATTYSPQAADA